jgi:predicted DsbA family dithiol-disulfide isomerase
MINRVTNIWADVICPFAISAQFGEQAARELQADLRWLPFEIHPDTPPEGAPKPFSLEEWPLRVGVVQSGSAISG